jgi:hypothetical protein
MRNRREFITIGGMTAAGFGLEGCTFASAIQELQQWAPTVLTAFSGIVTIIDPPVGSALALATLAITKLFGTGGPIPAAISAYQAAPGTGTLGTLLAVLSAANAQFETVLSDIPATLNPTDVQAVQASLLLLITTLESFAARLAPTPPVTQAAHTARAVQVGVHPAKDRKDFVKKWNAIWAGRPEHKLS